MKTTTKKRLQKLLTGVLVFAVGLLIANHVVFLHSHKLPDGSIIIHAHPYNKSQEAPTYVQ